MKPVSMEDQGDQFLIRVAKSSVDKETLIELLNSINAKILSQRADPKEAL